MARQASCRVRTLPRPQGLQPDPGRTGRGPPRRTLVTSLTSTASSRYRGGPILAVAEDLARVCAAHRGPTARLTPGGQQRGLLLSDSPTRTRTSAGTRWGLTSMCAAVARLSGAAARAMTARNGRIVNVSSVSGHVTMASTPQSRPTPRT
ncbi:hypothetical protein QJS66_09370 [Kocuria rhizophila]|nr:hypothetical protein QJS66_09370 [Kocuria rhizophila]